MQAVLSWNNLVIYNLCFISGLAASACLAGGLYGPVELVWLLPVSGLFFSIIFPTLTAVVSSLHIQNLGIVLGILFTFAGPGGVNGPWLVGIASDFVGLQNGFGLNLVFALLTCAAVFLLLQKMEQKKTRSRKS